MKFSKLEKWRKIWPILEASLFSSALQISLSKENVTIHYIHSVPAFWRFLAIFGHNLCTAFRKTFFIKVTNPPENPELKRRVDLRVKFRI